MKSVTRDEFKRWQPLPALAVGRGDRPAQNSGARGCDPQRRGSNATPRTAARKTSDGSQTLKFTFTTHD